MLIGTAFAIMHTYRAVFVLGVLAIFVFTLVFNAMRSRLVFKSNFRFGAAAKLGLVLLAINLMILLIQNVIAEDAKTAVKIMVNEGAFLGILLISVWRYSPRFLHPTLITLAVAFAWFAALNVVADRLGIGMDVFSERMATFESRFERGTFRWQAPLYSSWQLSGLLRWAIPILIVHLWKYSRHRTSEALLFVGSLMVAGMVAVLCEFRAAVFPLCGAIIWVLVGNFRTRALLSLSFVGYTIVAPFIFTQEWVGQFLQEKTPGFILAMAGNQDILGIMTLSGRSVMWQGALEVLAQGKYFWFGQGHVFMNAAKDIGGQDASLAQIFSRIGYHQGLLDIFFIYGMVPGLLILGGFGYGLWRAAKWTFARNLGRFETENISFALFSIGMVALSNCHDGYFLEHNLFYFITIISLCAISDSTHAVERHGWQLAGQSPTERSQRKMQHA